MSRPKGSFDLLFVTADETAVEPLEDALITTRYRTNGTVAPAEVPHAIQASAPDCIVLVQSNGEANWLETLRTIRVDNPEVPLLVFTETAERHRVEQALSLGATDIVHGNPADLPPALLRTRVGNVLQASDHYHQSELIHERYETILNTAEDAIFQLDPEGRLVAVNDAAVSLCGYERGELLGEHVSIILGDADIERSEEAISDQLEGPTAGSDTLELDLHTRYGEVIPCLTRIRAIQVDDEFVGAVGIVRDVRERLAREDELQRRENLLRYISETIPDAVWVETPGEPGVEFANTAFEDVWGRPADALDDFSSDVLEWVHPDDREVVEAYFERREELPAETEQTFRIVRPDGGVRWILCRTFLEEDSTLNRLRIGLARDVTDRKEREAELQAERDRIERIFDTSPVGLTLCDEELNILEYNEQAYEMYGLEQEEYAGKLYQEMPITIRHPDGEPVHPRELPVNTIRKTEEPRYDQKYSVIRRDGSQIWISVTGLPIHSDEGELTGIVIAKEDITDQVEREERLTTQRNELAKVNHLNSVIRNVSDALVGAKTRETIESQVCERIGESSRYRMGVLLRYVNGRLEPIEWTNGADEFVESVFPTGAGNRPAVLAAETGEATVVERIDTDPRTESLRAEAAAAGVESMAAIPITYDESTYGVLGVYATRPDSFGKMELSVLDELGGLIGHAIAALESREREEILTALYQTTEDLLAAESVEEVCDLVVETAADVLDQPGIGIFRFDREENRLRPAAATERLLEFYEDESAFGPGEGDSIVWDTFLDGEERFLSDVHQSERLANTGTDARMGLFVPLGDHGVFVVASANDHSFSDPLRHLIGLLTATTEAALDRVTGQAHIRERDEKLAIRAERVERLEDVLDFIRAVIRDVVDANTRSEVEEAVCARARELDGVTFAWMGALDAGGERVEPLAWAGTDDAYLDEVDLSTESDEPAVVCATSGATTHVSTVTDHLRDGSWAGLAIEHNFLSVLSVPVVHRGTQYAVLTLYATTPETFEDVVPVLTEFAEAIGYGINAVETRRSVLADKVTELELRIGEPDSFVNAVAGVVGAPVHFREHTPLSDERSRVLFSLSNADTDTVLDLESEFVTVESLRLVEREGDQLFRATLSGRTLAGTLLECGGIPTEITAHPEATTAVVTIPRELEVRTFIERLQRWYPDVELVSRRDEVRKHEGRGALTTLLDAELTERQREVLLTAFESGFFQSPRETTGAELAELLDISQPTLTHHLREAQRRLFTHLLDGD